MSGQMPEPGDEIAGRYRIERVLGKGGMGAVFQATHLLLEKRVAVKVLLPEFSQNEEFRRRFEREARVTSKLRHPNAVQVYDTGDWDGMLYLVMEYLEGHPLRMWLESGEPAPRDLFMLVASQLADVLVAAHDAQIVHRDLKPENIIMDYSQGAPRAVVVDFGLAFVQGGEHLNRLTSGNIVSGTPSYLSPEQAMAAEISTASDVYSMGCILYELLCGRPPFEAPSVMQIVTKHMFGMPDNPRRLRPQDDIAPELDDLVMRMLRKDPSARPTAWEVRAALANLATGPDSRRSGALRDVSRAQRMVEARTQRGEAQQAYGADVSARTDPLTPGTAPRRAMQPTPILRAVHTSSPTPPSADTVVFVGWEPDGDTAMALASNGFAVRSVARPAEVGQALMIVAPHSSPDDIAALSKIAPVVVMADPGDLDRVAALVRAGAADTLLEPLSLEDMVRKLNRLHRKIKRGV
jgi:serine/threonine protein kinase